MRRVVKQTARFLIRLYPAHWRERYGEEFETLLEDSPAGFSSLLDLLKGAIKMQLNVPSFPKLAVLLGAAGLLIGGGISFLVTPRYVSTAELTFEYNPLSATPTASRPNLREWFLMSRVEILSRTSLSRVITDPRLDLYQRDRARWPLEDVIQNMTRDIQITESPGNDDSRYLHLRVAFTYRDPHKAQWVVQTLITKFQESNLARQRDTYNLVHQLRSDEIGQLETRIAVLEKRLGIPASSPVPARESPVEPFSPGIFVGVLDPPSLPEAAVYPDRVRFAATGFAAGVAAALIIAIFRRRPPPIPFPAESA